MEKFLGKALTFDDVLLLPAYSGVLPDQVDVSTWLTPAVRLNIPLISAAMDTVTESEMAISMALFGGVGVIHKNMPIDRQRYEVEKVKKNESGRISSPITVSPEATVGDALQLMNKCRISGLPVVLGDKLVGILTNRDVRFVIDMATQVAEVMSSEKLVTVSEGISLDQAKDYLHKYRIKKLLLVDECNKLKGLITIKDIEKVKKYPNVCKDKQGRLLVGAAIGADVDVEERSQELLRAGADFLVIDSAHGHSKNIIRVIEQVRIAFPQCQLVAGNVGTYDGAKAILKAGADAVKVGVGPGSICTTRIVTGVGVPQITAVFEAAKAASKLDRCLVADGGIKFSGDVCKALAAGAHSIMVGSLFAGTDESPGETILYQGRRYKIYRGMGSIDAMREGSWDRYFQNRQGKGNGKLIPEGVVGRVPYRGSVGDSIFQLVGGLKSGMGYTGCTNIKELAEKTQFVEVSQAGLRESHVHDVIVTKVAPNYRIENC